MVYPDRNTKYFFAFKDGSYAGLVQLFNKLHSVLHQFIKVQLQDKESAANILLYAFVKVWGSRDRIENEDEAVISLYLAAAVKINEQREEAECGHMRLLPAMAGNEKETEADKSVFIEEVLAALDELPAKQKKVIILHYLAEKAVKEIADQEGLAPQTVSNQISRGINTLREWLGATKDKTRRRKVSKKKFYEDLLADDGNWISRSEENRLRAELLETRPWLEDDLQDPADVPTRAVRKSLLKFVKESDKPKDDDSGSHWRVWLVVFLVVAGVVGAIIKNGMKEVAPTAENAGQRSGCSQQIDSSTVLHLADGRVIATDTIPNGMSFNLPGRVSLNKTGDSFRIVGKLPEKPGLLFTLSVGSLHRPLNILFPDDSRIGLSPATEFALSGLWSKDRVCELNKGRARFEVAPNSKQPFTVRLWDGTNVENLGTNFEIDASDVREPKVLLNNGAVRVTGTAGSVVMKPKEVVIVRDGRPIVGTLARDSTSWGWRYAPMVFEFDHASLDHIVESLSRCYGVTIYKYGNTEGIKNLTIDISAGDGPVINQKKINKILCGAAYIRFTRDSLILSRTR